MTSGMSPWDRKDSKFHGSLRGADSPRQSDTFQGRFGRMFRALPAAQFSDDDLIALASVGDGMEAEAETATIGGKIVPSATPESDSGFTPVPVVPDDEENFGIPAGYTYLGQFIDHDITFDPMSSLMKDNDPEALIDFRTPALDLDNIYGRGPADQPYMYTTEKGVRANVFVMGRPLTANGTPTAEIGRAHV